MDGRKSVRIDGLSKLTKVEDLRAKLVEPFEAEADSQRLFYRGKQVGISMALGRTTRKNQPEVFGYLL